MIEAFNAAGEQEQWFAVRVKSNREGVVTNSLSGKGYETFLPTFPAGSRREAPAQRPLFPGYVFCRFQVTRRLPILILPAVVHIVGIGKIPLAIDDEEMAALQAAVASRLPVAPVEYSPGQKVRVGTGPLAGVTGTIRGRRNDLLVVSITLLQRSVAVEMHPDWLTEVGPAESARGGLSAN